MSAYRPVVLVCDALIGDGSCLTWWQSRWGLTVTEARQQARREEGWRYTKGQDICPSCAGTDR